MCNFSTELGSLLGTNVDGTKYYIKSTVRESGKEEEFPVSFAVERDRDFVLTYGIKGDQVTYYVRYVDANGNNVAPTSLIPNGRSGPFVANKGDRVYVAYVEVDGYTPDAYNRTAVLNDSSTLLQSDGTYLFTFTYRRTPAATTTTTTTTAAELHSPAERRQMRMRMPTRPTPMRQTTRTQPTIRMTRTTRT